MIDPFNISGLIDSFESAVREYERAYVFGTPDIDECCARYRQARMNLVCAIMEKPHD